MIAIGIGQTVEVLESGERGVVFDVFTADNGSWAVGVLFGDDDAKYFRSNELDFIED